MVWADNTLVNFTITSASLIVQETGVEIDALYCNQYSCSYFQQRTCAAFRCFFKIPDSTVQLTGNVTFAVSGCASADLASCTQPSTNNAVVFIASNQYGGISASTVAIIVGGCIGAAIVVTLVGVLIWRYCQQTNKKDVTLSLLLQRELDAMRTVKRSFTRSLSRFARTMTLRRPRQSNDNTTSMERSLNNDSIHVSPINNAMELNPYHPADGVAELRQKKMHETYEQLQRSRLNQMDDGSAPRLPTKDTPTYLSPTIHSNSHRNSYDPQIVDDYDDTPEGNAHVFNNPNGNQ